MGAVTLLCAPPRRAQNQLHSRSWGREADSFPLGRWARPGGCGLLGAGALAARLGNTTPTSLSLGLACVQEEVRLLHLPQLLPILEAATGAARSRVTHSTVSFHTRRKSRKSAPLRGNRASPKYSDGYLAGPVGRARGADGWESVNKHAAPVLRGHWGHARRLCVRASPRPRAPSRRGAGGRGRTRPIPQPPLSSHRAQAPGIRRRARPPVPAPRG